MSIYAAIKLIYFLGRLKYPAIIICNHIFISSCIMVVVSVSLLRYYDTLMYITKSFVTGNRYITFFLSDLASNIKMKASPLHNQRDI